MNKIGTLIFMVCVFVFAVGFSLMDFVENTKEYNKVEKISKIKLKKRKMDKVYNEVETQQKTMKEKVKTIQKLLKKNKESK